MKHWNATVRKTKYSRHGTIFPVRGETKAEAMTDLLKNHDLHPGDMLFGFITISPNDSGFPSCRGGYVQQ